MKESALIFFNFCNAHSFNLTCLLNCVKELCANSILCFMAFTSLQTRLAQIVQSWVRVHDSSFATAEWVAACRDPRHGHFQSNIAMVLGKKEGKNPQELAQKLADYCLEHEKGLERAEVAGPGFANFRYSAAAILESTENFLSDPHSGISQVVDSKTYVVDYSSPNIAKPLHVGHLRSMTLGQSIYNLLKAIGHRVIGDCHLGDWGTQFGIILLGYKRAGSPPLHPERAMEEMEAIYTSSYEACKNDETLMRQARDEVVKLQRHEAESYHIWQKMHAASVEQLEAIYKRMDVHFDHMLGESFYNPWLDEIVQDLLDKKIASHGEGGSVAIFFSDDEVKEHGVESPFLIQKADGAKLYSTTDFATIRHRVKEWQADGMIYVTDGRQQMHFKQLFYAAQKWGYSRIQFEHAWFGAVLGKDKKPLKTREGTPIKLADLLNEAVTRAAKLVRAKRPELSEEKVHAVAEALGLGALKYADQAQNRHLDYVFDWDKLLAFDGNTAPYLVNAYVRARSIGRKASEADAAASSASALTWDHEIELELCMKLISFGDAVRLAATELRPHHLCLYLYELAGLFHRFFENCPVLQASSPSLKLSRLKLCRAVADTLARGLELLGISVVEEM